MAFTKQKLDSYIARCTSGPDGCILWTGYRTANGYPQVEHKKKKAYLHHLMLEDKLGRPIAEGMHVAHTCANRNCINADHLYETRRRVIKTLAQKCPGWVYPGQKTSV